MKGRHCRSHAFVQDRPRGRQEGWGRLGRVLVMPPLSGSKAVVGLCPRAQTADGLNSGSAHRTKPAGQRPFASSTKRLRHCLNSMRIMVSATRRESHASVRYRDKRCLYRRPCDRYGGHQPRDTDQRDAQEGLTFHGRGLQPGSLIGKRLLGRCQISRFDGPNRRARQQALAPSCPSNKPMGFGLSRNDAPRTIPVPSLWVNQGQVTWVGCWHVCGSMGFPWSGATVWE